MELKYFKHNDNETLFTVCLFNNQLIKMWGTDSIDMAEYQHDACQKDFDGFIHRLKKLGYFEISQNDIPIKYTIQIDKHIWQSPIKWVYPAPLEQFIDEIVCDGGLFLNELYEDKLIEMQHNNQTIYINEHCHVFMDYNSAIHEFDSFEQKTKTYQVFVNGKYTIDDEIIAVCCSVAISKKGFEKNQTYIVTEVRDKELILYNDFGIEKLVDRNHFYKEQNA